MCPDKIKHSLQPNYLRQHYTKTNKVKCLYTQLILYIYIEKKKNYNIVKWFYGKAKVVNNLYIHNLNKEIGKLSYKKLHLCEKKWYNVTNFLVKKKKIIIIKPCM